MKLCFSEDRFFSRNAFSCTESDLTKIRWQIPDKNITHVHCPLNICIFYIHHIHDMSHLKDLWVMFPWIFVCLVQKRRYSNRVQRCYIQSTTQCSDDLNHYSLSLCFCKLRVWIELWKPSKSPYWEYASVGVIVNGTWLVEDTHDVFLKDNNIVCVTGITTAKVCVLHIHS